MTNIDCHETSNESRIRFAQDRPSPAGKNPYASPKTKISRRRSRSLFLLLGLGSGFASGLSAFVPPLLLFAPALFFACAITVAVKVALRAPPGLLKLFLAVFCSYYVALTVGFLVPAAIGQLTSTIGACAGGFSAGAIGSLIIGSAVASFAREDDQLVVSSTTTIVGAVLGVLVAVVGVEMSDHEAIGHPYDDIFLFTVWQFGVAVAIGSTFIPPDRQLDDRTPSAGR